MEAIITFQDEVVVESSVEPMPMKVYFYFEDGPVLEDTIGSDMTIVLTGGIGPMGLQGPPGPPAQILELSNDDIDDILGIEEE